MANPTRVFWRAPTHNTDGSVFDQTQFKAWEVEINGDLIASIPAGWDADGEYEFPLADVAGINETGDYTMRLRVVNTNDRASDWSNAASFHMDFRVPAAPTGLSVG